MLALLVKHQAFRRLGGCAANALPISAAELLEDLTKEHRARMQKYEKEVEKSLQDLVAAQEVARKELLARLEAEKTRD